MKRDVFHAIADPTRREIINLLVHRSLNLNSIAERFTISRPAISKHIKILNESGLVVIRQQGRERFCEAKPEKLKEIAKWIGQYREFWSAKLDALENFLAEEAKTVDKTNQKTRPKGTKSKRKETK